MSDGQFERKWLRKYQFELAGAFAVYGLLLMVARKLYPFAEAFAAKLSLSLLPMIGFALAVWAIGRAIMRADELQRKQAMEVIVLAAAATMLLTFGYGFLEFGIGLPRLSMFVVWPVMGLCWILVNLAYLARGKVAWPWRFK